MCGNRRILLIVSIFLAHSLATANEPVQIGAGVWKPLTNQEPQARAEFQGDRPNFGGPSALTLNLDTEYAFGQGAETRGLSTNKVEIALDLALAERVRLGLVFALNELCGLRSNNALCTLTPQARRDALAQAKIAVQVNRNGEREITLIVGKQEIVIGANPAAENLPRGDENTSQPITRVERTIGAQLILGRDWLPMVDEIKVAIFKAQNEGDGNVRAGAGGALVLSKQLSQYITARAGVAVIGRNPGGREIRSTFGIIYENDGNKVWASISGLQNSTVYPGANYVFTVGGSTPTEFCHNLAGEASRIGKTVLKISGGCTFNMTENLKIGVQVEHTILTTNVRDNGTPRKGTAAFVTFRYQFQTEFRNPHAPKKECGAVGDFDCTPKVIPYSR